MNEQEIKSLLFSSITKDEWLQVKDKLVENSIKGDIKSITLLLSYFLGKYEPLDTSLSTTDVANTLNNLLGLSTTPQDE